MTIRDMQKVLDAKFLYGEELADLDVEFVFSADMMSDVLAFCGQCSVLITGLCNPQVGPRRCLTSAALYLCGGKCRMTTCWHWQKANPLPCWQQTTTCSLHAGFSMKTDCGEVLK